MKRSSSMLFRGTALAGLLSGAVLSLQAADTRSFGIARGQVYSQTSASAPAAVANYKFLVSFDGKSASIQSAFVTTPSQTFPFLPLDTSSDYSEVEGEAATLAELTTDYPNGQYAFNVESDNDGFVTANLTLGNLTFPTPIPHISNFTAAQSIDAAANFTLTFDSLPVAANDRVQLVITDGSTVVFTSTSNPAVIPAGTLEAGMTYEGKLRFIHDTSTDTSSIPGATGRVSAFNETRFSLKTTGGSSGGNEPTLVFTSPSNGSQNVSSFTPVTFVFSTEMENTYSIQWSANVNTALLNYSWQQGNQALLVMPNGAFPAGQTITWTLNPVPGAANNFRSSTGVELPGGYTGSFTMAGSGGGNTNCTSTNPVPSGMGSGFLMKELNYVQTSDAAPALDAQQAGTFIASYHAASNQTVTAVSLTGPSGSVTLSNLFGTYMAFGDVSSAAALEAALPAGNYTFTATGAGSGNITVGNPSTIPVPHFLNLSALTNMDVTKPFVLRWDPFTGATGNDSIALEISADSNGGQFHAPDYCLNIKLTNTDTQITIPANTFKAGHKYQGSLTFARLSNLNTNAIPNTALVSQLAARTSFDFTQGGSTGRAPEWLSNIIRNPDGTVTLTLQADTGVSLAIEGSNNLNGDWTQETVVVAASGSAQFTFNPKNGQKRFYRARLL